ncbi:DUF1149 family protein [Listeria aquatica]|uniref:DUF1149 family protein n=1 Tax=Listeria aquatica FSL S10-1188 TaxID=1265818 RepID=W7BKZ3_9LIST|nr:DUF1149 family protein [Listeria aquatica]EUJ20578.1 hypothetical protein MAQA_04096 [Listeria aquatica FSL S10-1188]
MEFRVNQIIVEQFNFETLQTQPENAENSIQVQLNEVEPTGDDKSILDDGKIFKVDMPFLLVLDRFKVSGHISRIVQVVDFFGEAEELGAERAEEMSKPLISYIKRLTYEVTEIAFDEPGYELDFESHL